MQIDNTTMDIITPPNAILSGFYKRSFANYTIKERLPRILTQIIDTLVRNKDEIGAEFGKDAREELKNIIGEVSKLKYEIQTNKAISNIKSKASDAIYYNYYLHANPNITYYTAVWLYSESYMYRRIHETCELSTYLKDFDCFQIQKRDSFRVSTNAMEQLGSYLVAITMANTANAKDTFIKLLKLNLWGNKADLSFSNGQIESSDDPFELLQDLESNILCDKSEQIWKILSNPDTQSDPIDIILDNVGYELFTDLCLADFILTRNLTKNIRLYVKTCPYFISDVTKRDFEWTLNEMRNNCIPTLQKLGERWTKYIESNRLTIVEDNYWITALDYSVMQHIKPKLYNQLSEAKLVIFKGDLNYRKLIGERNWNPTTPFCISLQAFCPTKVCALRTLKCDIVTGLQQSVINRVQKEDAEWMVSGNYGVIQFADFQSI